MREFAVCATLALLGCSNESDDSRPPSVSGCAPTSLPSLVDASVAVADDAGVCADAGACLQTVADVQCAPYALDATNVYCAGIDTGLTIVPRNGGAPVTVARGRIDAFGLDTTSLYWASDGSIMKMPLGGGIPTTILSGIAGLHDVIAADGTNVYFTTSALVARDAGGGLVEPWTASKVPVAGGTATVVDTMEGAPLVAIDAQNLYLLKTPRWSLAANLTLSKIPLAGGPPTTLVTRATSTGTGLTVDGASVVWSEHVPKPGFVPCGRENWVGGTQGFTSALMSVPSAGGDPATLATFDGHTISGFGIDASSYYAALLDITAFGDGAFSRATMMRVRRATQETSAMAEDSNPYRGASSAAMTVFADETSVYWSSTRGLVKLTPK
jgi:hypothetical protein